MWRRLVSFGLIGVVNTGVDWLVFWAIGAAIPGAACCTWLAKAASYCVGVMVSFLMNSRITFRSDYLAMTERDRRAGRAAFARFWTVALLCLTINSATYEVLRGTGYFDLAALVMATLAAFVTGFALNQLWTFRAQR